MDKTYEAERLKELQKMSTAEAARSRITPKTPEKVKQYILNARASVQRAHDKGGVQDVQNVVAGKAGKDSAGGAAAGVGVAKGAIGIAGGLVGATAGAVAAAVAGKRKGLMIAGGAAAGAAITLIRSEIVRRKSDMLVKEKSIPAKALPAMGLKEGDILLMHPHYNFGNQFIAKVTNSDYSHAAVYSKGHVWDMLAADSPDGKRKAGINVNTLDGFIDRDRGAYYTVYRPKDPAITKQINERLQQMQPEITGYANVNAVMGGFRDNLGIVKPEVSPKFEQNYKICSQLVADAFGTDLYKGSHSTVTPGRIAKHKALEQQHTLQLSLNALQKKYKELING
ncbi:MAG: hypothetical protein LBH00_07460 [Planctomycetaceae bacterium]|nr:hypothetical protein [Planctomycetaceae bacterium]